MRLGLLWSISWHCKPIIIISISSGPGKLPDVLWACNFQVVDLTVESILSHDLNTSTPIIHHEEEVSIFNCISLQVFKRDYDVSKLVSTRTITFFLCIICTAWIKRPLTFHFDHGDFLEPSICLPWQSHFIAEPDWLCYLFALASKKKCWNKVI